MAFWRIAVPLHAFVQDVEGAVSCLLTYSLHQRRASRFIRHDSVKVAVSRLYRLTDH
jgi:hypothetical protein